MVDERPEPAENVPEPEADAATIEARLSLLADEYYASIKRIIGKEEPAHPNNVKAPVYRVEPEDQSLFDACRTQIRQAGETMSSIREDIDRLGTSHDVMRAARRNFEKTSQDFWAGEE